MAALGRAVAFAEVDGVAVAVGEHLDLNVAHVGEILLEQQVATAEGGLGLGAGGWIGPEQVALVVGDAHAPAAAPR